MMIVKRVFLGLIVLAAVAFAAPQRSLAQHYQPFGPVDYNPDLQLFAPVNDFLLEEIVPPNEGYFFSYERMHWSVSRPERTIIGADIGAVLATIPTTTEIQLALDQANVVIAELGGSIIVPQFNGIQIAVPRSEWGWGNRYELGYLVEENGWLLSILGGIKQDFHATYGGDYQRLIALAGADGLPGVDGIPVDDPLFDLIPIGDQPDPPGQDPLAPVPGFTAIPAFDGFREVSVLFLDPLGLLDGFVDLNVDTFPDDLNGNGIFGNAGSDTDGDGVPDTPAPIDFDDSVRLATIFDVVEVRDRIHINGVELMKIKRLQPTHRGAIIEIYYGVRYMEVDNRFGFTGLGGVLGDTEFENRALNRIIGPQIGFRHYHRRRRWTFGVEGRFLAGANFLSIEQDGVIGNLIVPGAPNNPYALAPSSFINKFSDEKFSPVGELRVETAFQVTQSIALQLGWTGLVSGQITRASNTILYRLPNLGILERDEDVFAQGVNFGVEINR